MLAPASPGHRGVGKTATNATTAMTTMVENSRRTMYAIIRRPASQGRRPLSLLDVPQQRDRGDDDAAQIRTIGRRKNELRRRNIRNKLEGSSLHRIRRFFRSHGIVRGKPHVAQFLDFRVVRPPQPTFL